MKKISSLVALLVCAFTVTAAQVAVVELQDEGIALPVETQEDTKKGEETVKAFSIPPDGGIIGLEKVLIASLPTATSPSVVLSRSHAMAGLAGMSVPRDRSVNPAAWHLVPPAGLQSYDYIETTFDSWLGITPPVASAPGEKGHRVVVHVAGHAPVSAYENRISSTDSAIGTVKFHIGINTATGQELGFSTTFVGFNFGANGKLDSTVNPQTGQWTRREDDSVFTNGEKPSQVSYTHFLRFGATVVVKTSQPSDLEAAKNKFAASTQELKVELLKDGSVVASQEVTSEEVLRLEVVGQSPTTISLRIVGGATGVAYRLQSSSQVAGAEWTSSVNTYSTGSEFSVPKGTGNQFFRLSAGG